MMFVRNNKTNNEIIAFNIKSLGCELTKSFLPILENIEISAEPQNHNLISKAITQSDIESSWFVYWCKEINIRPVYHRKQWELAFTLQVAFEQGALTPGKSALGFGCGREPLGSYFAKKGMQVTVTDLAPERLSSIKWQTTQDHTTTKEKAYHPDIVPRDIFDKNVKHKFVDMNEIPDDLINYDFCWSICSLEHLGSIKKGLDFVKNSLKTLKKGGIAVHTTEFNYISNNATIDSGPSVLFRKRDLESLANDLRADGHQVLGINYDTGNRPLDRFIDMPPYPGAIDRPIIKQLDDSEIPHLKLTVGGFACTCIGIAIIKG